jgi:hypothetical protein
MNQSEYIDELRQEFITVFNAEREWTKARLTKLKLMDSCMKESNRIDPASLSKSLVPGRKSKERFKGSGDLTLCIVVTINRVADYTMKLSGGTIVQSSQTDSSQYPLDRPSTIPQPRSA